MPSVDPLTLSQLLMTRFCHDMSGVMGSIYNGVEFMEEADSTMHESAMTLIAGSARQSLARLHYYRAAYGLVKDTQPVDWAEKQELITRFFAESRLTLHWEGADPLQYSLHPDDFQILLCLLLITSGALIRGGAVSVHFIAGETSDAPLQGLEIVANGAQVRLPDEIKQGLVAPSDALMDTQTILACYTGILIVRRAGTVQPVDDDTSLTLRYHRMRDGENETEERRHG
jgi:histidine phosphotransferase ChpT